MEDILNIFANNSIGVACLIYFMFRDYKLMSELKETMSIVKEYVRKQEKRMESENDLK